MHFYRILILSGLYFWSLFGGGGGWGYATSPAISRPEAERFLRLRWSSVPVLRNIPNTCRYVNCDNNRKWPA